MGFGQYRVEGNTLVFTEFAMSCRVAGKFVESALFAYLLQAEGCTSGIFEVVKTKKDILLRRTLEQIGFVIQTESEGGTLTCLLYFNFWIRDWNPCAAAENGRLRPVPSPPDAAPRCMVPGW